MIFLKEAMIVTAMLAAIMAGMGLVFYVIVKTVQRRRNLKAYWRREHHGYGEEPGPVEPDFDEYFSEQHPDSYQPDFEVRDDQTGEVRESQR